METARTRRALLLAPLMASDLSRRAGAITDSLIGPWGRDGDCGNKLNRLTIDADTATFGDAPGPVGFAASDAGGVLRWPDGATATLTYDPDRAVLTLRRDGDVRAYRRCRLSFTR